jgi:hypothetical protein
MTTSRPLPLIVLAFALALGCAHAGNNLRPAPAGERVTDSPAEKLAAMPVPDPAADPENKDQRFGIESARDRGQTAKAKREEQRRCLDVVSPADAAKGKKPTCPPPSK